eukprot:c29317_g1_i1 orf=983-1726(+)
MQARRRQCLHSQLCICSSGPLSELVIFLVIKTTNWNPYIISATACVCRWFADLAKRVLWKEFCLSRGPKMVSDLAAGQHGTVDGGWNSLGKLMFYCAGCHGVMAAPSRPLFDHFVRKTRFSKTSGKSFLVPQCRTDILYLSDPCEHLDENGEDDIGLFRGVFKAFGSSKTRKMLIEHDIYLEQNEICPYCFTKGWNMLKANMIPKSACRRVGAYEDEVEFFICVNGHLHGKCSLLHLSGSEAESEEE